MGIQVEYRIIPNDGRWYWEVIKEGHEIVARGVADTEPDACQQANEAARKAKLVRGAKCPRARDSRRALIASNDAVKG
jgi:hypothetical protein